MFIKVDKTTGEEEIISSEEMLQVLEEDLKADQIDETLTDIVLGLYEHTNRIASYKYQSG